MKNGLCEGSIYEPCPIWYIVAKTALLNIGEDITRLTTELQREDLTDAEEQEVFDELNTLAEQAKAMAARTPEPETPPTE